jgi:hypothetical protein
MNIPEGYALVQHIFTGESVPLGAAITYGIALNGGSWDPGDAGLLHDAYADTLLPWQTVDTVLSETRMKAGPNDVGPTSVFSDPRSGGSGTVSAPPNVAFLIEKNTALGGRRNRGRFYMPGVPEAGVADNGFVETTTLGNLTTGAADFLARIQAEVLQMVVLHTGPSLPTVVTSLTPDPQVATQRRRLRR